MIESGKVIEKLGNLAAELHKAGCKSREDNFHVIFTDILLDIYDEYRFGKSSKTITDINAVEDFYSTIYQEFKNSDFNSFERRLLYDIEIFVHTLRGFFSNGLYIEKTN